MTDDSDIREGITGTPYKLHIAARAAETRVGI